MEKVESNSSDTDEVVELGKESSMIAEDIIDYLMDSFQIHYYYQELDIKVPKHTADNLVAQLGGSLYYSTLPCPDQKIDDLKGNQIFDVESDSKYVFEYLQDDEPKSSTVDFY